MGRCQKVQKINKKKKKKRRIKETIDKPSFVKEIYAINDINTLREIIIRKERERQSIANDLEVAARIGLVISETNEAIQLKVHVTVIHILIKPITKTFLA